MLDLKSTCDSYEDPLSEGALHEAEIYLVQVVDLKSTCDTYDEPGNKICN